MKAYTPEQVREIEDALLKAELMATTEFGSTFVNAIATLRNGRDMEVVAQVESFTNGSHWRNYKLKWGVDVAEQTPLYAIKPSKD